jgi:hypothetical protein
MERSGFDAAALTVEEEGCPCAFAGKVEVEALCGEGGTWI